jgi:hypothetical protein
MAFGCHISAGVKGWLRRNRRGCKVFLRKVRISGVPRAREGGMADRADMRRRGQGSRGVRRELVAGREAGDGGTSEK